MKLNQLRKRANDKGFTLIELMIVVAIIGILAAIAIPNFLGMQEKAKRRSVETAATSAKAELHSWLDSSLKKELGVIDFDGNGVVDNDEAPVSLLTNVPSSWIDAFINKKGSTPYSPWFGDRQLFTVGDGPTLGADASGIIVFSRIGGSGRTISITGYDKLGSELYKDTVSVD